MEGKVAHCLPLAIGVGTMVFYLVRNARMDLGDAILWDRFVCKGRILANEEHPSDAILR